jgi:hypothetical protein
MVVCVQKTASLYDGSCMFVGDTVTSLFHADYDRFLCSKHDFPRIDQSATNLFL